jgi:oligopeptide/dipeptide ABC transporter ATP-binding protein
LRLAKPELRAIRGAVVSYVFQEPSVSLNPVMRIGDQVGEALQLHRPEAANAGEVARLLRLVGIPEPERRAKAYPFQLSGGMQQRVMMAIALAAQPRLLVADEPTTALDVTIQAQLLELIDRLRRELGMAVLLITHNLAIVKSVADRVAVMYAGQVVESGPAFEVLRAPLHPYTRALLNSVPRLMSNSPRLASIPGTVPHGAGWPPGCRFAPRCPLVQPACTESVPALAQAGAAHSVRCPYANPAAPRPPGGTNP